MITLDRSTPSRATPEASHREAALAAIERAGVALSASGRAAALRTGHVGGAAIAPAGLQLAMQGQAETITPSAEDLRVINASHSGRELTADEVVVFQDYAACTARVPRPPIRFTRAYLDRMAEAATEGRTVLFDHRDNDPIGATFAADVVEYTVRGIEAEWLRIRWYAVVNETTSEERRQRVQDCETGVLRYCSIRAMGGSWDFHEAELPDGSYDYFYVVDAADDANLGEHSRVYLGAVPGAGDHKFSFDDSATEPPSGGAPKPDPTSSTPRVLCVL